jgi:hypothetical protein
MIQRDDNLLEMDARLRGTTGLTMYRRDIADYLGAHGRNRVAHAHAAEEARVVEVAGRRIEVLTAFFIDEIEMQNVIPMMVQRYQEQRLGD